jgi:hypothetical protein
MKTVTHENMEIEDFNRFFISLKRDHPKIMGAEWDEKNRKLKIFYEDGATELTDDAIRTLKIPTVLRFRKKVEVPKIDAPNVLISALNENEFVVETFDAEALRKEVKQKLVQFEEVKT